MWINCIETASKFAWKCKTALLHCYLRIFARQKAKCMAKACAFDIFTLFPIYLLSDLSKKMCKWGQIHRNQFKIKCNSAGKYAGKCHEIAMCEKFPKGTHFKRTHSAKINKNKFRTTYVNENAKRQRQRQQQQWQNWQQQQTAQNLLFDLAVVLLSSLLAHWIAVAEAPPIVPHWWRWHPERSPRITQ